MVEYLPNNLILPEWVLPLFFQKSDAFRINDFWFVCRDPNLRRKNRQSKNFYYVNGLYVKPDIRYEVFNKSTEGLARNVPSKK